MNGDKTALEDRVVDGARQFSPSALRNRDPIREAFLAHMPTRGAILEIGSGTGEHAVHLAAALPEARWLPGDPDALARASIAAWTRYQGLANIAPPHAIDVMTPGWESEVGAPVVAPIVAIVSINMAHIAPFEAAKGLFAGAGRLLGPGGKLFLYGPFSRNGAHVAPSNAEFDRSLKALDPRFGVRDLEGDLLPLAAAAGLGLEIVSAMPANNFSVVFARKG
jgi:SAM-dependent methyltransferase